MTILQRSDRKRLQIDGLFKSNCGSPPRTPASRRIAFIATNAARRNSNRCSTQLQAQLKRNSKSCKRSSKSCKRRSDSAVNATHVQPRTQLPTRRCVRASRRYVQTQISLQNAGFVFDSFKHELNSFKTVSHDLRGSQLHSGVI